MKLHYILQLADDALILGHRLSEWCGHGPILEQDIALTNMSLDHLGRARSLYQYAATIFNSLPMEQRLDMFSSVQFQNIVRSGAAIDEDDLAYLRDEWDYRNILLAEQPNIDWAYTIARAFFIDTFNFYLYTGLKNSTDESLAGIAEKSLKEITYHMRWSSEWIIRLGDGTTESRERIQTAINNLWGYTGEFFTMTPEATEMAATGTGVNLTALQPLWAKYITEICAKATLAVPPQKWMQQGGKEGRHTEHLGYILSELQYMQRAYPGMKW